MAHEANGWLEFTWQAATGETLEIDVRRTDADNRWIVRCSQSGSTIKLIERNGGSETERASAAQTWTNGTNYVLMAKMVGTTIVAYVDRVLKISYASATFNQTATGAMVSGFATGTHFATFPRTLSGAALAALEAI